VYAIDEVAEATEHYKFIADNKNGKLLPGTFGYVDRWTL
jgi:hypothetical protein